MVTEMGTKRFLTSLKYKYFPIQLNVCESEENKKTLLALDIFIIIYSIQASGSH